MTGRRPQRAANSSEPLLVAVFDGQRCVGHVLRHGAAGFEAFYGGDRSLGPYPTQREAAAAIMGVQ